MRTSLLLLPALSFLITSASATLTIYEPFAYTAGGTLASQNGGTGFSGAWPAGATTHTLSAANTSLAYPASAPLTPQGARLEFSTTAVGGVTAARGLAAGAQMNLATNGLGFYASALISIGEIGQTASVQFLNGTNVRFSYGVNATGNFFTSVDPGSGSQVATITSSTAAPGTTYLLVAYIRTNTSAGNDEVFVSAFAPTDTVVFPANDNAWQAKAAGNSGLTLNTLRIAANNASTTTTLQLDEIRVGTTFEDVTGVIPEPGSALLSGLALALGVTRRKR